DITPQVEDSIYQALADPKFAKNHTVRAEDVRGTSPQLRRAKARTQRDNGVTVEEKMTLDEDGEISDVQSEWTRRWIMDRSPLSMIASVKATGTYGSGVFFLKFLHRIHQIASFVGRKTSLSLREWERQTKQIFELKDLEGWIEVNFSPYFEFFLELLLLPMPKIIRRWVINLHRKNPQSLQEIFLSFEKRRELTLMGAVSDGLLGLFLANTNAHKAANAANPLAAGTYGRLEDRSEWRKYIPEESLIHLSLSHAEKLIEEGNYKSCEGYLRRLFEILRIAKTNTDPQSVLLYLAVLHDRPISEILSVNMLDPILRFAQILQTKNQSAQEHFLDKPTVTLDRIVGADISNSERKVIISAYEELSQHAGKTPSQTSFNQAMYETLRKKFPMALPPLKLLKEIVDQGGGIEKLRSPPSSFIGDFPDIQSVWKRIVALHFSPNEKTKVQYVVALPRREDLEKPIEDQYRFQEGEDPIESLGIARSIQGDAASHPELLSEEIPHRILIELLHQLHQSHGASTDIKSFSKRVSFKLYVDERITEEMDPVRVAKVVPIVSPSNQGPQTSQGPKTPPEPKGPGYPRGHKIEWGLGLDGLLGGTWLVAVGVSAAVFTSLTGGSGAVAVLGVGIALVGGGLLFSKSIRRTVLKLRVHAMVLSALRNKAPGTVASNYFPGFQTIKEVEESGYDVHRQLLILEAVHHLQIATDVPDYKANVNSALEILSDHPRAGDLSILQFEGIAHRLVKLLSGNEDAYREH
ncbi:MAG: hypothetical protein HYY63_00685, partial [Elusimicrobia bacterium]|nr:hypothetical protein [Elusimicrobiota bacterium]